MPKNTFVLPNYTDMTPEEIGQAMLAYLEECGQTFSDGAPATPENINWMFAVYAIDRCAVEDGSDLQNLLSAMNKHYEGPISVHEGWGGCEADSNLELITEKLVFDLRENIETHNSEATLAAVKLGWVDANLYQCYISETDE
jgi:hypothetical protein